MAKVTELSKYAQAKKVAKTGKPAPKGAIKRTAGKAAGAKADDARSANKDIDHFIKTAGLDSRREKEIGQHIGYRYDVRNYLATMGWQDLNWLEDVHLGYEEGKAAVFDRNVNGWVTVPEGVKLPDNQQDRDMLARELLIKFQMSPRHPLVDLHKAYRKF
jgi:hypothetical protein